MRVLVTGNGGREHALAWQFLRSAQVDRVYVAPGNAGTAAEPGMENVAIDVMDFPAQIAFARDHSVDLTVIGPEAPLVAGAVDAFNAAGLRCFGPDARCAQLEGSKSFTKAFMARHAIPTAAYEVFDEVEPALRYLFAGTIPVVIKADGLAAGKGVVVATSLAQAETAVREMLSGNAFGEAGAQVVIEEFMPGEEATFIVIADGKDYLAFPTSQDHKAAFDGDEGPNTGGMGAYSPAPVVTDDVAERIVARVIEPTLRGMAADGMPYTGFLYAGLMIDAAGNPRVVEFNCRFGDPETQPVMMRLQSDLFDLCNAALDARLAEKTLSVSAQAALAVVIAAGGYPASYEKGHAISGLADVTDAKVFHAGTAASDSDVVTAGGRVLAVTALGDTITEAQQVAYREAGKISFVNKYQRSDIGYRAVAREQG